jgi:hypothetical protein
MLALYNQMHREHGVVMPIALVAGAIASALLLAYGMMNFISAPSIVAAYEQNPTVGGTIYLTQRISANAMSAAALFAMGWAIMLTGWAMCTRGTMPRLLAYLMLFAGGATLMSFVILPIGLLGLLLAPVWSLWVGIALLYDRNAAMNVPTTKPTAV